MEFFKRLWKWRREPTSDNNPSRNLAFVLLAEARRPNAADIVTQFAAFAAPGETLVSEADAAQNEDQEKVISLRLSSGELYFVALMPIPVPNGEADNAARFSLSSFRAGWKLPPHQAHLTVFMMQPDPDASPLVSLSRFTSVLAAVSGAARTVGIYWGNAGATHDPEFFASVASDQDVVPRLMLWTGVSVARQSDGRVSLLSLGMAQLALPNLLLVAGEASKDSAFETMFDLLAYVARRGEPLREGETVGRTDEQRLPVKYVPSPIDPKAKVWRVELP